MTKDWRDDYQGDTYEDSRSFLGITKNGWLGFERYHRGPDGETREIVTEPPIDG